MLIDAHCHLDHYADEIDDALSVIERDGILTISNAMDPLSYERACAIAARCPLVLPTFGIHPRRAPVYRANLDTLAEIAGRSPMLGELGLDFYWVKDPNEFPAQIEVLEHFLKIARVDDKPVNLHTKGAERLIFDMLDRHDVQRAIIHWYSGPHDVLRQLIDRGCFFTIGVEILCSDAIKEIARIIPLEQVLTETDNPGGYRWLTGTPSTPEILHEVVEALAATKEVDRQELVGWMGDNLQRLFAGKDDLEMFLHRSRSIFATKEKKGRVSRLPG